MVRPSRPSSSPSTPVLDGFDLGAGFVYGLYRDPERKRALLASISPVWSGNEVWLLAGLGSLLAAFPPVYSALLSSLYVPVILVLMAIVFRACGVELRSKTENPFLLRLFDLSIFLGSLLPAWAIGLVAGNVLLGFPLDASGSLQGSALFFLNPFSLAASLASLAAFTLHGLVYTAMKNEGAHREAFGAAATKAFRVFAVLVIACVAIGSATLSQRYAASQARPLFWVFAILFVIGYSGVPMDLRAKRMGGAFAASAIGLVSVVGMSASLLYPRLLPSRLGAEGDLDVARAASADPSLKAMLIIALVALPLVAIYSFVAYRSFKGKARGAED